MKSKIILSILFATIFTAINACDYTNNFSSQQDNLPYHEPVIIFVILQPFVINQLSEEEQLHELATSTLEWQLYEKYKQIRQQNQTTLFEEECQKSSCDQSNICKLSSAFKKYTKSLDEEFAKVEKEAHNKYQQILYEYTKQNNIEPDQAMK